MTKGKKNAVIVMSVAVLLLVSMAVSAGIVGTDKILSFLGGKKPGTTEVTGDDGSNVQFVTSRPAKLSAILVRTDKLGLSSSSDTKTNSDIIAKAGTLCLPCLRRHRVRKRRIIFARKQLRLCGVLRRYDRRAEKERCRHSPFRK